MKTKLFPCAAGFVLLVAVALPSAQAEPSLEKKRDLKKLLVVSGIYEQMGYMKRDLLRSFSRAISFSYPKAPGAFWDEFNQIVGQKEMDELIDRVILVYDRHMSHEVVRKLIKMFETPFWEEWRKKMPVISREAGLVGSEWMQEISQSDAFNQKIDNLIKKYQLDKTKPGKKPAP